MMRIGERAAQATGVLLLCLVVAEPCLAASRACRALEAELASVRSGGSSAQFRKYDRAVTAQRQQLFTARARARQAGCGLGFLSPQLCGPLNDQIDRMESNLAALERKRDELGGARPRRSRTTILAALEANGCRDEAVAERKPRREKETGDDGNLFTQLFGGGIRQGEALQRLERPANVTRILNPNGQTTVLGPEGEFSTMCVRTCDGYFFPISPNSSSADFERDQKNCEASCPGTEVQLYYRPAGNEATDMMMSVADGEPYSSLPTANLYRDPTRPRPTDCVCSGGAAISPNYTVIGGETESDTPVEPVIPAPAVRPDPAADPETLANSEGKLDAEAIKRILKPKPALTVQTGGERKVRVVGPVFLPDPEGAIDLKAPARKEVQ